MHAIAPGLPRRLPLRNPRVLLLAQNLGGMRNKVQNFERLRLPHMFCGKSLEYFYRSINVIWTRESTFFAVNMGQVHHCIYLMVGVAEKQFARLYEAERH